MIRLSITIACVLALIVAPTEAGCKAKARRRAACSSYGYYRTTTTVYVGSSVPYAGTYATAQAATPVVTGDPSGFGAWINATRAAHGLGPVAFDAGLASEAAINSSHGMGHTFMGHARRQNAGSGSLGTVEGMWMHSHAHRSAILDPSITTYGIAQVGTVWTFSAR